VLAELKIIRVVPEKPEPIPWKQIDVIAAGLEVLRATEGVKASRPLRRCGNRRQDISPCWFRW
jgi:hypothetical protein